MFRTRGLFGFAVTAAVAVLVASARSVERPAAKMTIESPAFPNGQKIPVRYTGDGEDASPPLKWSGVPDGTRELALICDDPDAPGAAPWVHWVICKIPPETVELKEGMAPTGKLTQPPGALQGKNSWGKIGYRGPAPPRHRGPHRYFFTLYALDAELDLKPGVTKAELLAATAGHVLGEAKLMGVYER